MLVCCRSAVGMGQQELPVATKRQMNIPASRREQAFCLPSRMSRIVAKGSWGVVILHYLAPSEAVFKIPCSVFLPFHSNAKGMPVSWRVKRLVHILCKKLV